MNKSTSGRIGVAVDVVIFTVDATRLRVLLALRSHDPYAGCWALPGGFVRPDESAETAAERELAAKTGLEGVFLEQLYTFSDPQRDPRNRVVSIAYYALVAAERLQDRHGLQETKWHAIDGSLPSLGFDHGRILETAVQRIRGKLEYAPIGFQLLPEKFTLTEIQRVYEAVLGRPIDKRNFRSKLLKSGQVQELDAYRTGAHRPARLYEFTRRTF
jgi:8-oxo-dGTP diphosphatase